MAEDPSLITTPVQLSLNLQIAAEKEIDGVGMGVLSDGTPFITLRGLARMAGVDHTALIRMTAAWTEEPLKPREKKIRELVRAQGGDDAVAFHAFERNGSIYHAMPPAVCMAVLEYYAFEAKGETKEQAANSYRLLARKGLRDFIYAQVGYNPAGQVNVAWQQFHDRVSLNYHTVPDGHFSVFKELADMLVTLIREGVEIGPETIPDISVGIHWGKHWTTNNLDNVWGARRRYEHSYPDYFPQSASNPQDAYCYPDDALPEFRKWVREVYIKEKLPAYLETKVSARKLPAPVAAAALKAFEPARPLPRG